MNKRDKVIEQITRLLAIANNTTHEAEAETAFAQASRLMIKYRVEEAEVQSKVDEESNSSGFNVDHEVFFAFAPNARAKVSLASWLGQTLGVRITFARDEDGDYRMNWYGGAGDMELLFMLYTSIAQFGVEELKRVRKETGMKGASFSNSFWMGYASRVSDRVSEVYDEVMKESPGSALVLASQMEQIELYVNEQHPDLIDSRSPKITDMSGFLLGDESGGKAQIDLHHRIEQ